MLLSPRLTRREALGGTAGQPAHGVSHEGGGTNAHRSYPEGILEGIALLPGLSPRPTMEMLQGMGLSRCIMAGGRCFEWRITLKEVCA